MLVNEDDEVHVLVNLDFSPDDLDRVRAVDPRLQVHCFLASTYEDLLVEAKQAQYDLEQVQVFCGGSNLSIKQEAYRRLLPNLKLFQVMSAGYDDLVDTWLFQDEGPMVATASGVHAGQMGEYVIGTILAWQIQLPMAFQLQQQGEWFSMPWRQSPKPTLRGRTIGIVGYGAIGREVGRLAQTFGMRVLALKKDPDTHHTSAYSFPGQGDPYGIIPSAWYGPGQLREMVQLCDYLVLAMPLTEETEEFLDAEAIAAMRPNTLLVNVGRGDLVDEPALLAALQEGRLSAALDVVSREPLPASSPFWQIPPQQLIVTPHIAGTSDNYNAKLSQVLADNLARWLAGKELYNRVH